MSTFFVIVDIPHVTNGAQDADFFLFSVDIVCFSDFCRFSSFPLSLFFSFYEYFTKLQLSVSTVVKRNTILLQLTGR